MAYNAGEYRIMRAFRTQRQIARLRANAHLPHGLSHTTYDYVAKLQALACLFAKPERHGLTLPRAARFVPLVRMILPDGRADPRPGRRAHGHRSPRACARSIPPIARAAWWPVRRATCWRRQRRWPR